AIAGTWRHRCRAVCRLSFGGLLLEPFSLSCLLGCSRSDLFSRSYSAALLERSALRPGSARPRPSRAPSYLACYLRKRSASPIPSCWSLDRGQRASEISVSQRRG